MNVLFAVLLMILVVGIEGVNHERTYLDYVAPGSPAAKAGWKPGDRLVEINGEEVDSTDQVARVTRQHAGEEITVLIERRGQIVTTRLTPRENPPEGQGRVGITMDSRFVGDLFVEGVAAGSAAEAAGLQTGDLIVSINDRTATDFLVMRHELERFQGFSVPFEYERNGVVTAAEMTVPTMVGENDIFETVGLPEMLQKPTPERVPFLEIIPRGFQEAYDTTIRMVQGIRELFSSRENLSQVAGPVGMGQLTSELVETSPFPLWVTLANLAIILSLNLAVLNLLPLPALDGGRLFFVLIEVLRGGRKIAPEKEGIVHFAGLVVLIGFMFVVGFFDVNRLIDGRSFIP
jgi:regulator of sigma E protease